MNHLTSRIPQGTLAKARLITAIIACVNLGGQLTQVGSVAHGVVWHAMSRAAVVAIVVIVVMTYRRGRTMWFDPIALPVLLVMVGSGLADSVNTTGPCIGVMVAQSLYGSHRAWLIRSAGTVVALPLSVALSPFALDRPVEWTSSTVVAIVPQLVLIAIVLRAMCVAMIRQEQASARESVLARTGRRLLAANDLQQARTIGEEAMVELADASPGVVLAVLVRRGERAEVVASTGFTEPVNGQQVAAAELSALVASADADRPAMESLRRGATHVRQWKASRLEANDTDLFLVAGAARAVPAEVFDAFLNLSHQVALAESSCLLNAQLHHQANHDQLTALPTRAPFVRRLTQAIDAQQNVVALLNVDLDDFKSINDTYGHGAGDDLLLEIAARLQEAGGPHSMAARFGGDEFAVLLNGLQDPTEAVAVADRICRRIVEPVTLQAATVTVGASIGVVVAEEGLSAGDILRCADIAMYSAKALGKNRVEQFSTEHHGSIARHRILDEHFAEAIPRGEITLRYQPIIDLRDGACCGMEAVAYWQHPTLGLIPPAEAVAVAERTGQMTALGTHVLQIACHQAAEWSKHSQAAGDLRVSVNVRGRQVTNPQFASTLRRILTDSTLPPHRLVLELAESEYADDPTVHGELQKSAAMGVRIALDDFGAGYSSLASLRSHPIFQIKLDRSLVDNGDLAVLQLVVSVSDLLGAQTVAQGLAGDIGIEEVRRAGVNLGQGPAVGTALTAGEVVDWLSSRKMACDPATSAVSH